MKIIASRYERIAAPTRQKGNVSLRNPEMLKAILADDMQDPVPGRGHSSLHCAEQAL